jgi:hypothetical protein
MAAPVVASYAEAVSLTCAKPAGTASGDVLYACIVVYDSATVTMTPPSGWTSVVGPTRRTSGSMAASQIFRKVAGSSEPSSYTFANSTGDYTDLMILRVTGADAAAPEDGAPSGNSGSSSTRTGLGVTTTGADRLLLMFSIGYEAAPSSGPAGMTELFRNDSVNAVYAQAVSAAGATGDRSHAQDFAATFVANMVAVAPAAADSGTSVALTGQALSSTAGTLAKTFDIALPGQSLAAAQGPLAPSASVALGGLPASVGHGALTAAAGASAAVALTGQGVSGACGGLGVTVSASVTLAGQGLGLEAGTLGASATGQAIFVSLIGQGLTLLEGALEIAGVWSVLSADPASWNARPGAAGSWSRASGAAGGWR